MDAAALAPLAAWESFYVIIGSSAAALTGLQFVVIALGSDAKSLRGPTISAFGTPTIVQFCVVLLISAILSAPWGRLTSAGLLLGATGVTGLIYTLIVVLRARRQTIYKLVLEDWIFYGVIPFIANSALVLAAVLLPEHAEPALFAVGTVSMLLLFVGIHNAWDTVTFIALQQSTKKDKS